MRALPTAVMRTFFTDSGNSSDLGSRTAWLVLLRNKVVIALLIVSLVYLDIVKGYHCMKNGAIKGIPNEPVLVVSGLVKINRDALAEGVDQTFLNAGGVPNGAKRAARCASP